MKDGSLKVLKVSNSLCQLVTGFRKAEKDCDEEFIIKVSLLFCFKLGDTAAAGHRKLCQAFDEDSICGLGSGVRKRKRVDPRQRPSSTLNLAELQQVVYKSPKLIIYERGEHFNVSLTPTDN